jgi:hypothetical protein
MRFQNRKLRQVVAHAYDRVPYYRELFDRHRITPADIRSVADLPKIPITTRSDIRSLGPDQLIAGGVDVNDLFQRNTTGVTGQPLTVWRTPREELLSSATIMRREARALGVRRGDRVVLVKALGRGRPPREKKREKPGAAALRRMLTRRSGADRIHRISSFIRWTTSFNPCERHNPTCLLDTRELSASSRNASSRSATPLSGQELSSRDRRC